MRIAVLGLGAMGAIYAGLLADAGLDVSGVDIWAEHVDAIRRDGLRISGASGDRVVRLKATTNFADVGKVDLVIISTKASGVVAAATSALEILADDGAVLTIQNGLGSADRVAEVVGQHRVMIGVVGGFGASVVKAGHVHHTGSEFVRLGEYNGGETDRLKQVAALWQRGGFKVLTFPDIHKMVWEKFICNVAFSGTCAVLGFTIGEVLADKDASAVSAACATEAWNVARAKKINIDIADPVAYTRAFGEKIANSRPSLLLDQIAKRRSEIDAINGAVPVEAARLGLEAPTNAAIASLIRAREATFG